MPGLRLSDGMRDFLRHVAVKRAEVWSAATAALSAVLPRKEARKVAAASATRDKSTVRTAARFARFILAMTSAAGAVTAEIVRIFSTAMGRELDAAMAAAAHARVGSRAGLSRPPSWKKVKPSAMATEVGALKALAERTAGRELRFDLAEAAVRACGGHARRKQGAHRTTKVEVMPATAATFLWEWWLANEGTPVGRAWQLPAFLTLAVFGGGLPIGMLRAMRTEWIGTEASTTASEGDSIEYSFQGPRKVEPRTALEPEDAIDNTPTLCLTASSVFVRIILLPYVEWMNRQGSDWLFPAVSAAGVPSKTARLGAASIEAYVGTVVLGATVHGIRIGVRRALTRVHETRNGPTSPVPRRTRNALQARSNAAEEGAGDVYDLEDAEELWEAQAAIHQVRWTTTAGGLRRPDEPDAVDIHMGVVCNWCFRPSPEAEDSWVCGDAKCHRQVCRVCAFDDPGDLTCHATRP
jgi:hypothetical protein